MAVMCSVRKSTSSRNKSENSEPWKSLLDQEKLHAVDFDEMAKLLLKVKQNLKGDRQIIDSLLKEFFSVVVDVHTMNLVATKKQRETLGPLIKELIPHIDACLTGLGEGFDDNDGAEALIIRSGFQIIIDNFGSLPDELGEPLQNAFKYFERMWTIEALDKSLSRWKECPFAYEDSIIFTLDELTRPKGVPDDHHWWFDELFDVATQSKQQFENLSNFTKA